MAGCLVVLNSWGKFDINYFLLTTVEGRRQHNEPEHTGQNNGIRKLIGIYFYIRIPWL